jgi:hypothetical protein
MRIQRPAVSRTARLRRRAVVLGVLGAAALVSLTACGSSGGSSASSAPSSGPSAASNSARRFPGVTGTIAAATPGTLQVQNPQSGQTAVTYTSTTPVTTTVPAARAALVVGRCATVGGTGRDAATAGSAQTVTVSTPQGGSCTRGFGGRGAMGGSGSGAGAGAGTPRTRPSGAPDGARFGGVNGTITSVTPTSFVVTRANPSGGNTTSTVTTTAATVYEQLQPATDSALRVGQCLTALGRTGDTGALAATSLAVRAPGPQGCVGFRGGNGAGQSAGSSS